MSARQLLLGTVSPSHRPRIDRRSGKPYGEVQGVAWRLKQAAKRRKASEAILPPPDVLAALGGVLKPM